MGRRIALLLPLAGVLAAGGGLAAITAPAKGTSMLEFIRARRERRYTRVPGGERVRRALPAHREGGR